MDALILPARGGRAAPVEQDALVVLPARVVEGVGERPAAPQQLLADPRDQLTGLDRLVPEGEFELVLQVVHRGAATRELRLVVHVLIIPSAS